MDVCNDAGLCGPATMTPERALDAAFAAAPRRAFLPEGQQKYADQDRPLPIGWQQTNSQPRTVRHMLALLDVRLGLRILDVGCGSAWTTALLAHLVGPVGEVVGVEIVPELVGFGRRNLAVLPLTQAHVEAADPDVLGRPDDAPFDRVLVSAGATRLPDALVEQLGVGGVLVVPLRGVLTWVQRTPAGTRVAEHGAYSFVPLVGG